MNTFRNETCTDVKHRCFVFPHIIQIHLNIPFIDKFLKTCKKTMLAAVKLTVKQLIAALYLMQISAHPAFWI